MRRFAAPLVASLAFWWFIVLLLTPFLTPILASTIYALGSLICHQLPQRSFHLVAMQLPVCARCTGIYAGAAFAGAIWLIPSRGERLHAITAALSYNGLRRMCIMSALPTVATVAAEWSGAWQPSNLVRALSGTPLGMVLILTIVSALAADTAVVARQAARF